jgi:glycosyltransferase involved in cell wall biosynthesis
MTAETGLLVPPGDSQALADAVAALLGEEPRRGRAGAAARRVAEERYSWDRIGRRLVDVYEGVLAGGVPRPAPVEALTA